MKTIDRCRYCGCEDLYAVLDLGAQPPSNSFVTEAEIPNEVRYPLETVVCEKCHLMQLRHVLPPEVLFDRYLYLSSTSGALRRHYAALAAQLAERYELRAGDVILDIGCNDGTLLAAFDASLTRVGVEPSQVADRARATGLAVFRGFFDETIGAEIIRAFGRPKLVTATNVFPHVDEIHRFSDALVPLLGATGVFVLEASYLPDMLDQGLFDTIYHEHLCYLSLTALVPFIQSHGLEVIDAERVPIGASGPAIRVHVAVRGGLRSSISPTVSAMLSAEEKWGVQRPDTYHRFADRTRDLREKLREFVDGKSRAGARIGAYGAPAKGNTLLNYVGFGPSSIEMIAETNELKHGLLTPGSHIPVVSEAAFLSQRFPFALLLSWNYLDYFLERSEYIRQGGRFIVPLPDVELRP